MNATLLGWSAWAPGVTDASEWKAWSDAPERVGTEGAPGVGFLPAPLRRRCTRLSKMMLSVAFAACPEDERASVRTVFASRHGAIHVAMRIFASIAEREPVSPLQFSHSVHNAQAGLFSIAAGNRSASSALAAEAETFPHAFLEALLHLERAPDGKVLLVLGDEPVPDNLRHLVDEPEAAYALGLLLANDGGGIPIRFGLASPDSTHEAEPPGDWPLGLEFVRWLLSDEARLRVGCGRRDWWWEKAAA